MRPPDLTRLPVVEGVVGFLILMIVITFYFAFSSTNSEEGEAVSASPTAGSSSPAASASPDGTTMTMHDNRFDPNELTVQAGSTVTLQIRNEGKTPHNMHVAGAGGDYTEDFCTGSGDPCSNPNSVRAGQTATLTFQAPGSGGEVKFRCDFHPQEMTGKIKIQ